MPERFRCGWLRCRSDWCRSASVITQYAQKIQQQLQKAGFRVELDARNEKMNGKIRDFTMQKVPFILVMGDKEAEANAVSVRTRGKGDGGSVSVDEFVARIQALVESKSTEL